MPAAAETAPLTRGITIPSTEGLQTIAAEVRASGRHSGDGLLRDPQALITSVLLLLVLIVGVFASLLAPLGANESSLSAINAPVGTPGYPLGADESGRDILSRMILSTQTAVVAGLIGAGVALVIGVVAGLIGGYFGRVTQATPSGSSA